MCAERLGGTNNDALPSQKRRSLVFGILATMLGGRGNIARAATGYKETPLAVEDLLYFDNLVSNPTILQRFQRFPTLSQVASVVRVLARADTKWARRVEENQSALHAGARTLFDEKEDFAGNGTILRIRDTRIEGGAPAYRYVVVTAAHVADESPPPKGRVWIKHPKGYDVAVCEISAREATLAGGSKPDALHLGTLPAKTHQDISGEIGVVIGRDNDVGVWERKAYPSLISPALSQEILKAMNIQTSIATQDSAFRMVILPPRESKKWLHGAAPAQGMSGSGVLYMPRGAQGVEYGGLIVSVAEQEFEGTVYSIAFIIDHTYVRETIDELFKRTGS